SLVAATIVEPLALELGQLGGRGHIFDRRKRGRDAAVASLFIRLTASAGLSSRAHAAILLVLRLCNRQTGHRFPAKATYPVSYEKPPWTASSCGEKARNLNASAFRGGAGEEFLAATLALEPPARVDDEHLVAGAARRIEVLLVDVTFRRQ